MDIIKAIKEAKEKSKKRNFVQSIDLIINFKGIDFSKVENRLNLEIVLPKGLGKKVEGVVIADDDLLPEAKKHADKVITQAELEKLGKNKREAKKLASKYKFFIASAKLMPLVGRSLGQVLGPRNKMPKPVPPNAKLEGIIERMRKTVRIKSKGKYLPTIHTVIGSEEMSDEDLGENAMTVINAIKEKLPNKEGNIRSIYVKTSMGPSVKVE
ncbi:50S ribosomal protein L1 [Candidatus Micrarchaeota archaeon]|nr:MAG: 50S ribosomal protein L1 [Candidatus Micrarchaeota archaeon]